MEGLPYFREALQKCIDAPMRLLQGLKPGVDFIDLMAQLKLCPFTHLLRNGVFYQALKSCPDTKRIYETRFKDKATWHCAFWVQLLWFRWIAGNVVGAVPAQ